MCDFRNLFMCKFLFVIFKVSITKIIKVGFTHFLKHYPEILFNLIKMGYSVNVPIKYNGI